jgi:hypothetical protein
MDPVGRCDVGKARIMEHRTVVADHGGKAPHVNPQVSDELSSGLGIRGVELERDAIAAQQVTQVMAVGSPLLTDDAIDDVARPMSDRPRREEESSNPVDRVTWHPFAYVEIGIGSGDLFEPAAWDIQVRLVIVQATDADEAVPAQMVTALDERLPWSQACRLGSPLDLLQLSVGQ